MLNTPINPILINRLLDLAVEIQQIPAPTFEEAQRAAFVYQRFQAEGLQDVSQDELNNVYGRLPGAGDAPPLVVSAHLDTVFPANTDLRVRRETGYLYGPGIGDNSLAVAGLFGLLWTLRDRQSRPETSLLPGDVWLVANVCEEGLGDLKGMRAVVERFGKQPLAYLVLEGMALGQIYHRALSVQRYRITARTAGGHSWVNYGQPSAIHELAQIITHLTELHIPTHPRTSLNVGTVAGGTSINTIAAEAHLELDLRSESNHALQNLVKQVERLARQANRPDVQVSIELIGQRPAGKISTSHPLVRLARRCLQQQGIQPVLGIGSTDANIPLSQGLPAICLGLSLGGGAHTLNEYIDTRPMEKGLVQLVSLVEQAFSTR